MTSVADIPLAYRPRGDLSLRRAIEQGFTTLRDLETEAQGMDNWHQTGGRRGNHPGRAVFLVTGISTGLSPRDTRRAIEVPKAQLVDGPSKPEGGAPELEHGADWIKIYMTIVLDWKARRVGVAAYS